MASITGGLDCGDALCGCVWVGFRAAWFGVDCRIGLIGCSWGLYNTRHLTRWFGLLIIWVGGLGWYVVWF